MTLKRHKEGGWRVPKKVREELLDRARWQVGVIVYEVSKRSTWNSGGRLGFQRVRLLLEEHLGKVLEKCWADGIDVAQADAKPKRRIKR